MKLRTRWRREGRRPVDLRSTWQIALGSLLLPVGVAIVLIGWYGAAHASYVQQQMPYVVSGGFIGLGLMIVGALLYWAHWLYRIYDQAELHHRELLEALAGGRVAVGDGRNDSQVPPASAHFVATAGGSTFHRPECPIVARRSSDVRPVSEEGAGVLAPCRICEPLGPAAGQSSTLTGH